MTAPQGAVLKVPGSLRWALIGVGALAAVLGIVMISHPFTTAKVLAIIVGIELLVSGVLDLMDDRFGSRGFSIAAGTVGIVTGVLVIGWPGVTLWVLAAIVGFAFLLRGVMQVMAAFTTEAQLSGATGLLAVSGVLSLIVGVLALVWPHATIVVLAVLFGLRVLAVGLVQVAAGWALGKVDVEVIDV